MAEVLPRTKQCVACAEEIAAVATICPTCKEYQRSWRNELKFWAGIAGLIVLISSGIAFSFGSLKFARDYFRPPDIVVSEINTFGKLSIVNRADQSAWLRELRVTSQTPGHDLLWDLAYVLKPRSLHTVDMVELSTKQFRGRDWELFGSKADVYAQNLPPAVAAAVLGSREREQYVPVFLHKDGAEYRLVRQALKDAVTTFPCDAHLTYTFMESGAARTADIPCIGVIKRRTS